MGNVGTGGSDMTRWGEDLREDVRGGKVPFFSPPSAAEQAAFSQLRVLAAESAQPNVVAAPPGAGEVLDDGPGFWEEDINRGFALRK